jgi:hypothetical protein
MMNTSESNRLLDECRALMTNRMRSSMSRMMGHVEEVLFEMATVDSKTADTSHYIEAIREIRMKKKEIQIRFEKRFMSLFEDKVRKMKAPLSLRPIPEDDITPLNIIEDKDFGSETIQDTLNKARHECRNALALLDRHVSTLFADLEVNSFVNPMQPDTVFGAFWESCRDIRSGDDIRYILIDIFDRYVVSDLQGVYEDINTLFDFYKTSDTQGQDSPESGGAGKPNPSGTKTTKPDKQEMDSVLVSNWVRDRIQSFLDESEASVPVFIQGFLLEYWRLVVEDAYRKFSDESPEWDRSIQVIDDLITCVRESEDRDTKKRQIWMLPGLIYRLKLGMKSISLPLKIQADFLSQLKAYHSLITDFSSEK